MVIAAYNAAAYIDTAVASVRSQTLGSLELIVVDDCSTDETTGIVARHAAADERVKLVVQPRNMGPSAARNRGFGRATGRWIAILDADDAYEIDRLSRLVELGDRQNADLVADNLLLVSEEDCSAGVPLIPRVLLSDERPLALPEFIERNIADPRYPGCNYGFLKPIFRAEFLRAKGLQYDESVRFAEDFTLYVACLRAGATWWLSPEPTYRYCIRSGSLTQIQTVHDLGRLRATQASLLAEAADDPRLATLIRRHARVVDRCFYYRSFTDDIKAGRRRAATRTLFSSLRSARLIIEEAIRQMPTILRKAGRGGYRQKV